MSTQPKALALADYLDIPQIPAKAEQHAAAAELRRLQGEVESMRAERIATEKRVSVLHAALEASEASDAESLRLYRAARERADKLHALNAQMLDKLQNIAEYWNRDTNEDAMADACWHAINTALDAIDAAKEQS